jgi:cytochrome c biogenesis protein
VAFLNVADGCLVQDLAFQRGAEAVPHRALHDGQPKSFESDIELFDRSGKILAATIAVNHPLIHDGVIIYQASFADGGTRLSLRGWNLFAPRLTFPVEGVVHQSTTLTSAAGNYTLEFIDFRPFNIENMGGEIEEASGDTMSVLGGSPVSDKRHLRNVGPSVQFKLRDARGQAAFSNYMLPRNSRAAGT